MRGEDYLNQHHPHNTYQQDLDLCLDLAQVAARVAMSYFDRAVASWNKSDGTLVSEADHAVEQRILEILAEKRPGDSVVTEESSGIQGVGKRRWVIDPIDGTTSFVARTRCWGTHIALDVDGVVQVAVMTRPTEDRCWWAVRGGGAHASRISDPLSSRQRLQTSDVRGSAVARVGGLVPQGSPAAESLGHRMAWVDDEVSIVAALLEGRVDAVLDEGGDPWDQAPATLLVTEAGGAFCDPLGGRRYDVKWALYTNAYLQDQLMAQLGRLPRGARP